MEPAEFSRWYGPWQPSTPADAAALLAALPVPWWVVGGWAIAVATGVDRPHEDIDIAIFRDDLPALLDHFLPHHCVWAVNSGMLQPLLAPGDLQADWRQLWVRRDAQSPWLLDILLTPRDGGSWVSVRDARLRLPFADAFVERAGIRYLRPELVLHFKARHPRPKDEQDFRSAVPHLSADAVAWLRAALALMQPDHPWLERLDP